MNHSYDSNHQAADTSRNEFISGESQHTFQSYLPNSSPVPQDMQKIFSYMKNVMSNPLLMDQMEKFLAAKEAEKNTSFINHFDQSLSVSRVQSQLKKPIESYSYNSHFQQKPQPLKMSTQENMKKIKVPEPNNPMKQQGIINTPYDYNKKSLNRNDSQQGRTYQQEKNNGQQQWLQPKQSINEQNLKIQSKQPVSFEDIPIKSNYIAANQFSKNFDSASQIPASYSQNQPQFYNKPPKNKPIKSIPPKIPQKQSKINKYNELEERPINGTNKDFKQLLKQKGIQSPFDERPLPTLTNSYSKNNFEEQSNQNEFEESENYEKQKPKKQFLKRGSRQYLSSAKDKKSTQKLQQQNKNKDSQQILNNSQLNYDRQKDKTPTKRDTSQNRILSKRNTNNNNDKSLSKIKQTQNLNDSYNQQSFYKEEQQAIKRNITPKNSKLTVKSKSPILPPKNTKKPNDPPQMTKSSVQNQGSVKKKNVFDDSSSQSDNQSQNQQKNTSKRSNNFVSNNESRNQKSQQSSNPYQNNQEYNMFARQKKLQVIEGVFLTNTQLQAILSKHATKANLQVKNQNSSQEKFNQLRKKYTDLCNLVQKQKLQHEEQMQKQRQQFQNYKQQQIQKIKNERRVMERQVKSSMPSQSQNLAKDKQEIQNLKKQLEKQRQEHKKKEKNNKILIEKYKKQNQELKFRNERLQQEMQTKFSQTSYKNNFSSGPQKKNNINTSNTSNSRSSLINDKSKSKSTTKDVSPAKTKNIKNDKKFYENQQQENQNDKNYKQTVPLNKINKEKSQQAFSSQQRKKYEQNQNSEEDNLPTFKVQNKSKQDPKSKTQKKYKFIQNSIQQKNYPKKQNQYTQGRTNLAKANSKNVFVDDSDEQNFQKDKGQNQEQYGSQEDQRGFFKKQIKYESLSDLVSGNFSIKNVNPQLIEKLFRYQNNTEYKKYLSRVSNAKRMIVDSSRNAVNKKIINSYSDRSKQIIFENGVKKQIFEDGYTIIYFKNGDIKQILTDGTILYYFREKKVDQITLLNGLNIFRYDNNQVELHYDNGRYIEISQPDGTIKILGSPVH